MYRFCVWCLPAVVFAARSVAAGGGMVFPGKSWQEATPQSQGVDPAKLAAAVAYLQKNSGRDGVNELVIVRNGCMIWRGPSVDKVHGVWSLTKSFTSTVFGLLVEAGKCRLDTPAKDHVAAMGRRYPNVTLRHFATMTSGYRAVGDEPRGGYAHGPSPTPFEPADSPLFPPGSMYAYWDSAMNQFAHVLTRIAGEPIEELFRRKIAQPIGMEAGKWDWGDFGKVDGLVVNGGSGNNNKHIRISARELARLGHLFLNRGKWNGRQLIAASWVDQATCAQVPVKTPLGHPGSADGRGVYGYNWWVNGVGADGKRKWPGAPKGTYSASGYNNNDLFVVPEWNLVVVRLGLDQRDKKITDATYGELLARLGRAMARATAFNRTIRRRTAGPGRPGPSGPRSRQRQVPRGKDLGGFGSAGHTGVSPGGFRLRQGYAGQGAPCEALPLLSPLTCSATLRPGCLPD